MTDPSPFVPLVAHYEACLARHGDSPQGVDWPNAEDAVKRYRVMTELIREDHPVDLLDFGCGAAHLLDYLGKEHRSDWRYRGLDLSPVVVDLCRRKHPGIAFDCLDAMDDGVVLPKADYVVMNGIFTERCGVAYEVMFDAMTRLLPRVFACARRGLAFNLMSKHVEWERDDLFHVPYDEIARFIVGQLSRHHLIRADYGLFEYTVYVYKSNL